MSDSPPQSTADRTAARRATIQRALAEQQRKQKQRRTVLFAVLGVVLVAGGVAWAAMGSTSTKAAAFCGDVTAGSPGGKQWSAEPAMSIDTSATYKAVLKTSCGDIGITLDAKAAPHTVNSFVFLAGQKYFDHTRCHRLTTSGIYVLQCGDPKGTGTGTPGYGFASENLSDARIKGGTYPAGTVAMANTGQANSNGSQFFLVYQDSPLPASYTPFGTITSGLAVVKHIASDGSDDSNSTGDGKPNDTVVFNSVAVTKN